MLKILLYLVPIILTQSCGTNDANRSDDNFFSPDVNRFEHDEQVLPRGYVECDDHFYWNATNFETNSEIDPTQPSLKQISILADNPTVGPIRSGYGTISKHELTSEERELCYDIYRKINGYVGIMEYRLVQYFDYAPVMRALSSREFTSIDTKEGQILNTAFTLNKQREKEKFVYEVSIPIFVSCENPWLFKADPQTTNAVVIKQPEGKCTFSTKEHQIETTSGQKVAIVLHGYYEKDAESPQQRTRIQIERLGFKRIVH